jgi:hypothetical protein
MAEAQPTLLALPPPASTVPPSLRTSLRGAAAIPVDPVAPARRALDPGFGDNVEAIRRDRSSEQASYQPRFIEPFVGDSSRDWVVARFFGDQSVPFLAQQLGQSVRLVAPTLDANAEVAAYAAAQERAERAAMGHESLLDIRT